MSSRLAQTRFADQALPHLGQLRVAATAMTALPDRQLGLAGTAPRSAEEVAPGRMTSQLRDMPRGYAADRGITPHPRYSTES